MDHQEEGGRPRELGGAVRGYFVPVFDPDAARPVTFTELWRGLLSRWRWLLLAAVAGLALGAAAALLMRPVYHARVVVALVKEDAASSALGSIAGQLGGLASLAGVSLGTDARKAEYVAILMSRGFTERFIRDENLLPVLFASRWDEGKQAWKPHLWKRDPTVADAVRRFDRKIRSITEDRRSGIITLLIEWRDREQAARWANLLIERANNELRALAIEESRRNIEYLEREIQRTQVVGVQQSIYRIVENEVRRSMMANVRVEYAFRVLDPAVVSEAHEFVRPRRALLAIGGLLFSLMSGVAVAIALTLYRRER